MQPSIKQKLQLSPVHHEWLTVQVKLFEVEHVWLRKPGHQQGQVQYLRRQQWNQSWSNLPWNRGLLQDHGLYNYGKAISRLGHRGLYNQVSNWKLFFSNSLLIHEENTKENHKRIVFWYRGKERGLSLWRRANAHNVRLYYPYWQYTRDVPDPDTSIRYPVKFRYPVVSGIR